MNWRQSVGPVHDFGVAFRLFPFIYSAGRTRGNSVEGLLRAKVELWLRHKPKIHVFQEFTGEKNGSGHFKINGERKKYWMSLGDFSSHSVYRMQDNTSFYLSHADLFLLNFESHLIRNKLLSSYSNATNSLALQGNGWDSLWPCVSSWVIVKLPERPF